jgi:hypothetical protein
MSNLNYHAARPLDSNALAPSPARPAGAALATSPHRGEVSPR